VTGVWIMVRGQIDSRARIQSAVRKKDTGLMSGVGGLYDRLYINSAVFALIFCFLELDVGWPVLEKAEVIGIRVRFRCFIVLVPVLP
jgi:hypothetical protein